MRPSIIEMSKLSRIVDLMRFWEHVGLLSQVARACTSVELAELMGCTNGAAHKRLQWLEDNGYVRRVRIPHYVKNKIGRTCIQYDLTEKGEADLARTHEILGRVQSILSNENHTANDVQTILGKLARSEPLTPIEAMRLEDRGFCTITTRPDRSKIATLTSTGHENIIGKPAVPGTYSVIQDSRP